jgi:signal transduction histidine kinase
MSTLNHDTGPSALWWDVMRLGMAGRCLAFAVFALLLGLTLALGYSLHDDAQTLSLMWPASGLLLVALMCSTQRNWKWIFAVQIGVHLAMYYYVAAPDHWSWGPVFVAANSLNGLVAASLARRFIPTPATPRVRQILILIAAMALGAAVSALVGGYASIHTAPPGAQFLRQWQLWLADNWLGSMFLAPVLLSWFMRWRVPVNSPPVTHWGEVVGIGTALIAMSLWLFGSPATALLPILHPQTLLVGLVVVAAFRLPPRWSTTLTALCVLIAVYDQGRRLGPFSRDPDPFIRVGAAQLWLVTLIAMNYVLSVVLLEMQNTLALLRRTEERYRHFVEKTSEAVWQIELDVPMPFDLPEKSQVDWLHRFAHITECNLPYRRLNHLLSIPDEELREWRPEVPWSAVYVANLAEAASHDYSIDGLQFTVPSPSGASTYMAAFTAVVDKTGLLRLWGVARDITVLVDLNRRLKAKQERVQMYARQLTNAEERARRATAVDLHDGIGQQLVGIALTLEAAASRSTPEARLLLGEAIHSLREVHGITQRVIADLSPPGLYELGLEPALQWLSIYMRQHDNLQVQLNVNVDDRVFDLDLRILVFKLIRELLRNVVKHSGVKTAAVNVTTTPHQLRLEVIDNGVGFEWQLSLFEIRAEGFGLWSVAERIREAAGELTVDTSPGRGCRVSIAFPLGKLEKAREHPMYNGDHYSSVAGQR